MPEEKNDDRPENGGKKKMTAGEKVRMAIAITAAVMTLAGFVIAFLGDKVPAAVQYLPIPLVVVSIGVLLVLKTSGKSAKIPDQLEKGLKSTERDIENEESADTLAENTQGNTEPDVSNGEKSETENAAAGQPREDQPERK